jgi:hypothetical protein
MRAPCDPVYQPRSFTSTFRERLMRGPSSRWIFFVDDFRVDNGATRFAPGPHRRTELPEQMTADRFAPHLEELIASGPAGSVILFNASTWHGRTANTSNGARRSLQARFIPSDRNAATDFAARMSRETRAGIGDVGRYLIVSRCRRKPKAPRTLAVRQHRRFLPALCADSTHSHNGKARELPVARCGGMTGLCDESGVSYIQKLS